MYSVRLWSVRNARALHRLYTFFSRLAPRLAPLVRRVGERRAEVLLRPLERSAKNVLFDCRMCGQCVLSSTGMACPMNCAKQMRNGPCGGVRADGQCEVEPGMRCVWVEATEGTKRIAADHLAHPTPLLPAIDQRRRGRSTWIEVVHGRPAPVFQPPVGERITPESEQSQFERSCAAGRPVVTVEIAPPDSADPAALLARAELFRGLVDAMNITDGAGGNCHMSSVAASAILATHGFEPVYQIACRDRNRIAIQGDLLGAAALGVKNILCLTGDDVSRGDHPQAKPVFDLDAVSLLHVARGMCDRGEFASGRKLEQAPDLFIGATVNPFVPPYVDRVANLEKKIRAGARFIQTQFCFDVDRFADFMTEVRRRGLHRQAHILVGVGTLGSAKALRWMANNVPGVFIPEALLARIEAAPDQKAEAKQACIEIIRAVTAIEGVAGVHLMGHRNEAVLARIIVDAGLRAPPPAVDEADPGAAPASSRLAAA
ncbi:methylenetetrahydrofolate reductase C-terminal domain-containing protein [Thauera aromatica]|uniref:methylenetetrahydrofolate reductase C-terminal domain-containing protein n=1 Tax=Thauera aromatica TaxID=59405 RepID=UPI001FFC80AB|nr:methylenetetrahydrofolate reductase C-terminal domain-containing protein [Thauera aromatica]MCK2094822.1 methylenetetrahydrofolate reductase C-terminal domain-containing protein [Thauera aromatica]